MTTLRNGLVAMRGLAALLVAYEFIRNGAGALTQVAIALHGVQPTTWDEGQVALLGLVEIGATFALFNAHSAPRVVGAVLLLWCSMATLGGIARDAIPTWCVMTTSVLALVPRIPEFHFDATQTQHRVSVWLRRRVQLRHPPQRFVA